MTFALPSSYAAAQALEHALGNPFDPRAPLSFARSVALDETETFPAESLGCLHRLGFARHLVPVSAGGALRSFEEAIALQRVVARRDLTVAIALGQTFLGGLPVWVAGTELQRERLGHRIEAGAAAALALTEEAHGSDLLASDVRAERTADGFLLSGRKWLINNGTRGELLSVLARTESADELGALSIFLVDVARLPEGTVRRLPKVRTHGIRGADVSGVEFTDAPLGPETLVGRLGAGLDVVLKSLQISRIGCAGFSLGAADTALRTTLAFADARRLYGGHVRDLPPAAATLVDAFVELLVCECVAVTSARGIHAAPEQLSLWSGITKYLVPTRLEATIRELAVVLGARHYLREGHADGVFQKLLRDSAVVSLFDGSTAVNLDAIGQQLARSMTRRRRATTAAERRATLAATCRIGAPLDPFDPTRLQLVSGGRDDVLQALPDAVAALEAMAPDERLLPAVLESLRMAAAALTLWTDDDARRLSELASQDAAALRRSPQMFELARRHCAIWAACACLHVWLQSRDGLDPFFARGEWLVAALHRLLGPLGAPMPSPGPASAAALAERMWSLYSENKAFSHVPIALGGDAPAVTTRC